MLPKFQPNFRFCWVTWLYFYSATFSCSPVILCCPSFSGKTLQHEIRTIPPILRNWRDTCGFFNHIWRLQAVACGYSKKHDTKTAKPAPEPNPKPNPKPNPNQTQPKAVEPKPKPTNPNQQTNKPNKQKQPPSFVLRQLLHLVHFIGRDHLVLGTSVDPVGSLSGCFFSKVTKDSFLKRLIFRNYWLVGSLLMFESKTCCCGILLQIYETTGIYWCIWPLLLLI